MSQMWAMVPWVALVVGVICGVFDKNPRHQRRRPRRK